MSPTPAPRTGAHGKFLSLLIAIAVAALALPGVASAADRAYWGNAEGNTLSYASLDGSGGTDLPTGAATVSAPAGQVIDPTHDRIYWINNLSGGISYANLEGQGGGNLAIPGATFGQPSGLALDPARGRLYWSDPQLNQIAYANLDGSGAGVLSTSGATVEKPQGVAVDPIAGRIYWTNREGDKISYASLDGSGGADIDTGAAEVNGPIGLAVDPADNRVYWANHSGNSISYAGLDGLGPAGDLPTGGAPVNDPVGIAIDRAANRLYWANSADAAESIAYASLDGSGGAALNTSGAMLKEPNLPVLLQKPVGAALPEISGPEIVGKPLHCGEAKWGPDEVGAFLYRSPTTYAYSWLRNGELVSGAAESWYRPTKPGIYNCQVTAANQAGSTAQTSAELNLERGYAYANGFAPVHGRRALVTLTCTGDDRCKGLVKLIAHVGYKRVVFREGRRQIIRRRALFPIGKGRFSIYPGRTKVVHVKLKRKGARLLRRRPGRRWHVRLLGRDVAHRGLLLKIPGRGRGARHLRTWHRRPG